MGRLILFSFRLVSLAAALALLASLLAEAAPLAAQQLLPDGEFDGTLGSWHSTDPPADGSLALGANDATGCAPDSDSALAENTASAASYYAQDMPGCISPIVAGATYSFGGFIRFVTHQTATGNARFFVSFVDVPGCVGTVVGGILQSAPLVTTALAGTWVASNGLLTAPAGAQSARLFFRLVKDDAGDTLAARFDSVYFARGDSIFSENFEIGRTCRWSSTSP